MRPPPPAKYRDARAPPALLNHPTHPPIHPPTCPMQLSVVEYKTLVLRGDMETAASVLESVPQEEV